MYYPLIRTLIVLTALAFAVVGMYAIYCWLICRVAGRKLRSESDAYRRAYNDMVTDRKRIRDIIKWQDFYDRWSPYIHHRKRPKGWKPPEGERLVRAFDKPVDEHKGLFADNDRTSNSQQGTPNAQ